ncbi:MAG TPA: T9SS type A sorting domain-containing protein [Cryomorphaceae bacterium]|nr:T9SS type A sorting domain-containing protein [Cryomorphaceae bacterium]
MLAQEMIYPATIITEKAVSKKRIVKYDAKDDALLELPFVDDFSTDYFPGNEEGNTVLWEARNATVNNGLPINAPTVGVASFDGTDEVGYPYSFDSGVGPADTLSSCPIDLDYGIDDGVGLSFYFQPKGRSFFGPSATTDSLILEFYAPELDEWFWIWSTINVSNTEDFSFVYIPITNTKYLKEGFKFRFRNIAFLQGLYSVWNLDYVWLDQNSINDDPIVNDVAFVDGPISFLQDYSAMPLSHYEVDPSERMREDIQVLFRNLNDGPRTLEGNEIVVSHQGTITDILPNFNEPPIAAQSTVDYTHQLTDDGNQFTYETSLADDELIFDVNINLGTADFGPTVSNNSFRFKQSFYTHYSYDDGSAEVGYAVAGNGSRMALRYTNFKSDSVWALRIYTMPIGLNFENTPFTIKIWEDAGGVPGTELASALHEFVYGQEEYQELILFQFEEPVFIPSGTFFVGFQQSTQSSGLRVGVDLNTSGNEGNLYYDDGNGWQLTSVVAQASTMIHPLFTTEGYQDIVASTNNPTAIPGLRIYPNPANQAIVISTETQDLLSVSIFDISGRLIDQDRVSNRLNVSDLVPGIYLLQISDSQGRHSVKKLSIER